MQSASSANREIWTVSRLNMEVRAILESHFGHVWVDGEISNLARPRSGHLYFSLKDSGGQVRCAMFRGSQRSLDFAPENGTQVLVRGRVGLYAERGDYQLIVDFMEEAGAGALRRAYEALKARLAEEGLFSEERKQAVPVMPCAIGLVTSPTGAAIRDVLTTLNRRYPAAQVIVYPVSVQGDAASGEIEHMLARATERNECDVLILGRGGGSLEDLWAFNEERTARAIANCPIPIISAVGHEVDFTIADFVADARAPTPTAAAELVSPDAQALLRQVETLSTRANRIVTTRIQEERRFLRATMKRLVHPSSRLEDMSQRLDTLTMRLTQAWRSSQQLKGFEVARLRARVSAKNPQISVLSAQERRTNLVTRLHTTMRHRLQETRASLIAAQRQLKTVGPEATLARGYAIVTTKAGDVIRQTNETSVGQPLSVRLVDGKVNVRVED